MIVESRKMRNLLNSSVLIAQPPSQYTEEPWQSPRQYRFSMNPVPALVILLLGKMMSSPKAVRFTLQNGVLHRHGLTQATTFHTYRVLQRPLAETTVIHPKSVDSQEQAQISPQCLQGKRSKWWKSAKDMTQRKLPRSFEYPNPVRLFSALGQ